jgi:hypothetical protein
MRVVTGTPSSFDPVRKVAPQPFEDMLGQRGDDDLVEARLLPQRGLDGLERVGFPDDALDGSACRAAEKRDGGLKRPVGGALARLVRDQEREGARTFVRAFADRLEE